MPKGHPARLACFDTPFGIVTATKMVQRIWDVYKEELETVPPDLVLALRSAFDRSCVDDFRMIWGAGAGSGVQSEWLLENVCVSDILRPSSKHVGGNSCCSC